MKKLLSLFLVFAMVMTLCACGNAHVSPDGTTDSSTEATSGNTTEENIPVASGEVSEESTGATEKKPSRQPTEDLYQEYPASCEHGFADATCTKP